MKLKSALFGALALAAVAVSAHAAGIFTPGFPNLAAASITGSETLPADTNYTGGAQPQSVSITSAALKTYNNGGAIVTAAATAGAATANGERVIITSEPLTTAAGAVYTLTLTDSSIAATSLVLCSTGLGTDTTVGPTLTGITPGAGSASILVRNTHASAALNGTITVACRISN